MIVSLTDYSPAPRYDGQPWVSARLEGSVDGATWAELDSFAFPDPDLDPTDPASRSFTTDTVESATVYLRIVWVDGDSEEDVTEQVPVWPLTTALSTVHHVRVRLGSPLSDDQVAQAEAMIEVATVNILAALDRDSTFTVPTGAAPFLRGLCTELVVRAMANPQALGQFSETIGSYSYTRTFARELPSSGLDLTPAENLACRRRVFGQNSGSSRPTSGADTWAENVYVNKEPETWIGSLH